MKFQRNVDMLIALLTLAVIFSLVNGDLGKVILIELLVIAGESFLKSRFGKDNPTSYDITWERLDQADFEMAKFLLVALASRMEQGPHPRPPEVNRLAMQGSSQALHNTRLR